MPRSLVRGDYNLLMAIESSSRANSWYRVLVDRQSRLLSCDCPIWTFNRQEDRQGNRACLHTEFMNRLLGTNQDRLRQPASISNRSLLTAVQAQWPGLHGEWSMEERDSAIGEKLYHFVLVRLALGNGGEATGVVAFSNRHHHSTQEMIPGVAGWAGWGVATEVAHLGGFVTVGNPPEHFSVNRSSARGQRQRDESISPLSHIGLVDILRVGDIIQPGTNPQLIAENTLHLFMGDTLYTQLERQHFLDVSSVRFAGEQRVYRLRRDPAKVVERRVRVFKRSTYSEDNCIVRGQPVPEADFFLTNFLNFLSDEMHALSVVGRHNVFPPFSDSTERETIPAVWRSRVIVA
jgi:hypothetical protein